MTKEEREAKLGVLRESIANDPDVSQYDHQSYIDSGFAHPSVPLIVTTENGKIVSARRINWWDRLMLSILRKIKIP